MKFDDQFWACGIIDMEKRTIGLMTDLTSRTQFEKAARFFLRSHTNYVFEYLHPTSPVFKPLLDPNVTLMCLAVAFDLVRFEKITFTSTTFEDYRHLIAYFICSLPLKCISKNIQSSDSMAVLKSLKSEARLQYLRNTTEPVKPVKVKDTLNTMERNLLQRNLRRI